LRIVTDSAADLTPEETRWPEIQVAPLTINFPEGQVDAHSLSPDEFYHRLERMHPDIPTTAQPSAGILAGLYQRAAGHGEILSIHISSGLSGTLNAAHLAARQLAEGMVHLVDSLTLSGGQRFQVLAAAGAARAGWSREAILDRLAMIRCASEVVYTLDTLTYLAQGGRIGRVQALAGSLLNIKPIIHVDKADGKYSTLGRARSIRRALMDIANHLAEVYAGQGALWVSVMHGTFSEQAEALADLLGQRLDVGKIEILRISPVLGVHTGPGIVGAAVMPLHLVEDIAL
jgi:DegV family protein with EDD domain